MPEYGLAQEPNYGLYALPELISYLGYLAELEPFQRQAECEWLKRYHTAAPGLGAKLHLAFALLLAPACGGDELDQAIALFEASLAQIHEPQTRYLLLYHIELVRQRSNANQYHEELAKKLDQQWKKANRSLTQRLQECNEALREARSKLEALKAIEQSLNPTQVP